MELTPVTRRTLSRVVPQQVPERCCFAAPVAAEVHANSNNAEWRTTNSKEPNQRIPYEGCDRGAFRRATETENRYGHRHTRERSANSLARLAIDLSCGTLDGVCGERYSSSSFKTPRAAATPPTSSTARINRASVLMSVGGAPLFSTVRRLPIFRADRRARILLLTV